MLKWPGAWQPMIEVRDEIMAKALFKASQGNNPKVPAYIFDKVCLVLLWVVGFGAGGWGLAAGV